MIITELVERECCEPRDLREYHGAIATDLSWKRIYFCCHCGELWISAELNVDGGSQPIKYVRLFGERSAVKVLLDLNIEGGILVSDVGCNGIEIDQAKAEGRFARIDGLGFIRRMAV